MVILLKNLSNLLFKLIFIKFHKVHSGRYCLIVTSVTLSIFGIFVSFGVNIMLNYFEIQKTNCINSIDQFLECLDNYLFDFRLGIVLIGLINMIMCIVFYVLIRVSIIRRFNRFKYIMTKSVRNIPNERNSIISNRAYSNNYQTL